MNLGLMIGQQWTGQIKQEIVEEFRISNVEVIADYESVVPDLHPGRIRVWLDLDGCISQITIEARDGGVTRVSGPDGFEDEE
jgi:hypothetical protein